MCLPSLIHPKTSRCRDQVSEIKSKKKGPCVILAPSSKSWKVICHLSLLPRISSVFLLQGPLPKRRTPFEKSQPENLPGFPSNKREVLSIPGSSPTYLTKVMDILMTLLEYHTVIDSTVVLTVQKYSKKRITVYLYNL